ncbi:Cys-rich peptide radical SAM maturase CcpM [Lachnospiraceae bacterium MD308]|jgi:CLI_3235-class bacteriocin maturation radical SAM enzyme|nr:Cys-rich peptide radical SAM maturase CcpM [Lachnospiraceae bacterium MD308]
MEQKRPFIHTFTAGNKCYLYDVNTDKILHIPENVYRCLEHNPDEHELEKITDTGAKEYILNLKEKGFLKATRVEETEHPETQFLSSYLDTKVTSLILQVTQNCNLRCEYCVFSGSYYNRTHSNKRMSFEMAKKGIDFLAEHSGDSNRVHLGFYGGEPLLEFELIHKCMKYTKERCKGKKIYFNLTTNGTVLTKEMVKVFEKYDLHLMFSLDGPKEVHDLSRKFVTNQGSFENLMENVRMIKEQFPQFFNENVTFNTVLNPERGYSCISDFITGDALLKNSYFISGIINPVNSKDKKGVSEQFIEEQRYEYFLMLLTKAGEISENRMPPLEMAEATELEDIRYQKNLGGSRKLPRKSHHAGPCIPGSFRLFMNVDGNFYPCERVCENEDYTKMGNIEDGIDLCKAEKILNIERLTEEACHECWAYNYCHICVADIDLSYNDPKQSILHRCSDIRESVEDKFKDYCVLKEYGFQY